MDATGGAGFIGGEQVDRGITEQLESVRGRDPQVVVLALGANDRTADPQELTQKADSVIATITERWPAANLILVGPFWRNQSPPEPLLELDAHLEDKAAEMGVAFTSPIQGAWLDGLISTDNVHPGSEGHGVIASNIIPLLVDAGADQEVQIG